MLEETLRDLAKEAPAELDLTDALHLQSVRSKADALTDASVASSIALGGALRAPHRASRRRRLRDPGGQRSVGGRSTAAHRVSVNSTA